MSSNLGTVQYQQQTMDIFNFTPTTNYKKRKGAIKPWVMEESTNS